MKKQLEELKAERQELAAKAIKIVDADELSEAQFEEVKGLQREIARLDGEIAQREERRALVKEIGSLKMENAAVAETHNGASSLGEHFVKAAGNAIQRYDRASNFAFQAPEFKAASDPIKVTENGDAVSAFSTETIRSVVNAHRDNLVVADLMGSARMSNAVIRYLVEKADRIAEGAVATVAEGTKKPYVRYAPLELKTEAPSKIAALAKISDEMFEDLPFLTDYINSQLVYDLSVMEEQQLLSGDGSGANLTGLLNREGIQKKDISGNAFDGLMDAISLVSQVTPYNADALVLNPADYGTLRKVKDENGQYFAGGPFQGAYGNGGIMLNPPVWGLKVVTTNAIEQGNYVLGAFRLGATVLRRGGVRVDASNTNGTDFEENLMTLRAEERIGLMVPRPAAFVTGTFAHSA